MTRIFGSTPSVRRIVRSALCVSALLPAAFASNAFAQSAPLFTPGNLVVVVEGCGVQGSTCSSVPNGTGSNGSYGDNQAAPLTLFQFKPTTTASAAYVNSLVLPQKASGANLPIAGEYGSSSEGGLQLSSQGQYLTLGAYGINAAIFNAAPVGTYGNAVGVPALAQSSSLTGQSYTPIPRVATLIDAYGNVNSSSAIYNIFDTNNPRSVYTVDGVNAWLSGQGAKGDATSGVFYTPLFGVNNTPTAITGLDTSSGTASQDTRFLSVYNNTLYISVDTKGGSGAARSFIGTLGTPPSTTLFSPAKIGTNGPTQIPSSNNASPAKATTSTSKIVLTPSEANTINASMVNVTAGTTFNLSPSAYFFANASTLYIADTGNPKQDAASNLYGDGGLQKWVNSKTDGTGTWVLQYTMSQGLNLVANPSALPTSTAGTTGLYGLTGVVNGDGTVYLYATNATIGDLDPTFVYGITDTLTATSNSSSFVQLAAAPADSNFKGISFAPTLPAGSATINTVPSGLTVSIAGTGCAAGTYVAPVTLVTTPGSVCTLTTTATQTFNGFPYTFAQWQDGNTTTTDTILTPGASATYTATFNYQPIGVLEQVQDNTTGSGQVLPGDSILVSGWVADPVDGSPLSNVKVLVDGNVAGTPTLGIARPDIATETGVAAYGNSGYQLILPTTGLTPGSHLITVVATDAAGHSATFQRGPINVLGTPTVTVSSPSIVLGTPTVTLTGTTNGPAVTFTVNGSSAGVGTSNCSLPSNTNGLVTCSATYASAGLALGSYKIVGTSPQNGLYVAGTATGTLTVAGAPDFSFASSGGNSQTVTRGGSATYTFTVSPNFATYPGAVSFAVSGLPTGATATFSPATIPVNGGSQSITMTVNTGATSAANTLPGTPLSRTTLALAGLCLPFVFRRKLRSSAARYLVLLVFLGSSLVGFAALSGCSTTPLPTGATLTVTATSGSVSHSAQVLLAIQ